MVSRYNLDAANKAFTGWAAYLARDMGYDPDRPLTENRIENWREVVVAIVQQHKAAHEEIRRLRGMLEEKGGGVR